MNYQNSQQLTIQQAISRAKKATKQGNIAVAVNLYNAVLQQQPNHPIAKKRLRKLQKEFPQNQSLEEEISNPPQDQITALVNLYSSGQMTKTEQASRELLQSYPKSSVVTNVLGAALQGQGKSTEALRAFDKAIELHPNFPDAYNNRGNLLTVLGRVKEAMDSYNRAIKINPSHAEAYNNRGNAFKDQGHLEQAIDSYEKAVLYKPDYAEAHSNHGIVLKSLGRLEQALQSYNKAIEHKPDYAAVYNNRGVALQELGQLEQAVESCDKAIQYQPDYSEAYYNRGISLKNLGRLQESIESYEQAIQLNPDFSLAHYNLGNAFRELGKMGKAVECYDSAIQIKDDYADAYCNRAVTLKELGKIDEAVASSKKAASIVPLNSFYWTVFADVLRGIKLRSYTNDLGQCLLQVLEQSTISPKDVSQSVISSLQHHPILQRAQELYQCDSIDAEIDYLTQQLSTVPLLLRIMELSPVSDIYLEKIFTRMRKVMLLKIVVRSDEIPGLPFYVALAMHCFTNEYVFSESQEERQQVEVLQRQVMQALIKGEAVSPALIVILGAYKPLSIFSWSNRLTEIEWPIDVQKLIIRQVDNVREEQLLRSEIPCLTPIKDGVSRLVRSQYEENPYPRWISAGLPEKPKSVTQTLRDINIYRRFDQECVSDKVDILIAGCGTGQHALITASRFLNCNVLALDLSLSSLSYALRKTRELRVKNIEYIQGDILELEKLGRDRDFDVIESVGVLHHMDDPLSGWKALVDTLRIGGLMKIGLYSNIARQHIMEARRQIARKKYTTSTRDIRRYREEILNMDRQSDLEITKVLDSSDFYSLSACRDLLFHVQEHQFTLPQIEKALNDLGLEFLGFELKQSNVRSKFSKLYPEKDALSSLKLWHQFELKNPNTFRGMYQLWVQKA